MHTFDRWSAPVALWLLLCLTLAYVPDMGHGFISDDFGWILTGNLRSIADLQRAFVDTPMGFYRPLVSLSFGLNAWMAGLAPMGYALVNFALVCAIAVAIIALCRTLGFGRLEGLFAAAVWTFNIHGVGMALTWISGRTSLLATLFAVMAAIAVNRRRPLLTGLWTLAALLSKEEPILLPAILGLWVALDRWRDQASAPAALAAALRATWPSTVALGLYLLLRVNTAALTPWTAPSYYALTFSPSVIVPNVLEYADRSLTFAAALLLLLLAVVGRVPRLTWVDEDGRRAALKGAVWVVLGFGLTVMVPVRSDLYACFPAVGASLIAAGLGRGLGRAVPPARVRRAVALLLILPILLVPVYRGRNVFARRDAELSTRVLQRLLAALRERDDITRVEVYQDASEKPSVGAAFGGGLPAALELGTGRRLEATVHLTAPSDPWPAPQARTLRLTVAGEDMVAVTPPQ